MNKFVILIMAVCVTAALAGCGSGGQPSNEQVSTQVSKADLYPVQLNGVYGFADHERHLVIKPQFDYAYAFSEGLAGVKVGTKYGFINTEGEIVVPPLYDGVTPFQEGLAAVYNEGMEFDPKDWSYIDQTGKKVLDDRDYLEITPFENGLAGVVFEIDQQTGEVRSGVINRDGQVLYDGYEYVGRYSEKRFAAKKDGKWGFIDEKGKPIMPFEFDYVEAFHEGLAAVNVGDKWGIVNLKGEWVKQPTFDDMESFSEGLAAVRLYEQWGYVNTKGDVVIPYQYSHAKSFSNGLATVVRSGGELWGYLNQEGQFAIPPVYTGVYASVNGWQLVSDFEASYYVDERGNKITFD